MFATEIADPAKPGRIRKVYRHQDAMTPLEKLASLPPRQRGLRAGLTLAELQAQAQARSDLQAAIDLNAARKTLFGSFLRKQA